MRGEFVVLVAKATKPPASETPVEEAVESLIHAGVSRMDALKTVARERGLSKREIYRLVNGNRGPKPR
jgi:16S rRNA C1402 (ribose-2'-O) methylase RsmI